jgi:catecholate siderophore receptor
MMTAPRFGVNNAFDDPETGNLVINRQLQARDHTDTILQNATNLQIDFETGKIEHEAVVGLEATLQDFDNSLRTVAANASQVQPPELFNPNPNDPWSTAPTYNGNQAASSENFALYAFDTVKFNPQWQLSGGIRYDYFHTDYATKSAAGATTLNDGRYDNLFNWRAALTYKPVEEGSIYFGYGTSSNPVAEALTLSGAETSTTNLDLDPEESETFELGAKWDLLGKKLAVNGALFRTVKTNARTQESSTEVVVLDGEQVVQGIELGATGQITEQWRVFGGYTYMDGEVTKSRNPVEEGNETTNTPEHSFSLWTVYEVTDALEAGLGGQYVGDRHASTTNNRVAPSYWTLDAMAAYEINKNWSVRMNLYNLLDEEYIDRVGGGHFVPGAGRSVVFSTNYRF